MSIASLSYDVTNANPIGLATLENASKLLADFGRNGDTYVVHAKEGETVIPMEVLDNNPKLKDMLFQQMRDLDLDPYRYIVGNELNSINPETGQPEFFLKKLFKGLKDVVKKTAPVVLPIVAPYLLPTMPLFLSAGIGSLAGSLAGGAKPRDALRNAVIAGGLAGVGNMAFGQGGFSGSAMDSGLTEGQYDIRNLFGGEPSQAVTNIPTQDVTGSTINTLSSDPYATVGTNEGFTDAFASPGGKIAPDAPIYKRSLKDVYGTVEKPYNLNDEFFQTQLAQGVLPKDVGYGFTQPALGYTKGVADPTFQFNTQTFGPKQKGFMETFKALNPEKEGILGTLENLGGKAKELYSEYLSPTRESIMPSKADIMKSAKETAQAKYDTFKELGVNLSKEKKQDILIKALETAEKDLAPSALQKYAPLGGATALGLFGLDKAGLPIFTVPEQNMGPRMPTGLDLLNMNPDKYKFTNFYGDNPYYTYRAEGGEIVGPGTSTSDSIPAMLSDGEFVMNAKAVQGAGNGDRQQGAKRMYQMMKKFEKVA